MRFTDGDRWHLAGGATDVSITEVLWSVTHEQGLDTSRLSILGNFLGLNGLAQSEDLSCSVVISTALQRVVSYLVAHAVFSSRV